MATPPANRFATPRALRDGASQLFEGPALRLGCQGRRSQATLEIALEEEIPHADAGAERKRRAAEANEAEKAKAAKAKAAKGKAAKPAQLEAGFATRREANAKYEAKRAAKLTANQYANKYDPCQATTTCDGAQASVSRMKCTVSRTKEHPFHSMRRQCCIF